MAAKKREQSRPKEQQRPSRREERAPLRRYEEQKGTDGGSGDRP